MARRMSRPTRAILLMLALVWQTAALLTPWVSSHWVSELEHMAMHSQGNAHHHHDDLSLHMDDNDTSLVHQHADSSTGSIGLWQHTELHVLPVPRGTVVSCVDALGPAPFLDALLRPPQAIA